VPNMLFARDTTYHMFVKRGMVVVVSV